MGITNFSDIIERVREKTDIVQEISEFIPLDKNNKALCPFHPDKIPSLSVNPQGQYFNCFGCNAGGDVFKFLELIKHKSFMDVLNELANQTGISLDNLNGEDGAKFAERRQIEDILTETALYYHQNLAQETKEYLITERGFTEEIINRFQIGFANGQLRKHLSSYRNIPLELCLKSGVLKKTEDRIVKDFFYNRIIFPNLKHGRVVHLSGRSVDDRNPKYLHLPGKIEYLYNEDTIYSKKIFIVEGVTDCISAVQAGYPAVAILGTQNFKSEYVSKFTRCEIIYVCLDGDQPGEEGNSKIAELIGERARIIQLPEGNDVNDYFKTHSNEDFKELIASAKGIISYELSFIPPDTDKIDLPYRLTPILKKLAVMDKAMVEAHLNYKIKQRFKLRKEDIDGYKELIKKFQKEQLELPNTQIPSSKGIQKYTAIFDGLVDIVEHEGAPAFLVKEEDRLSILNKIEKDGVLYIPPPIEQIPWLLPKGEEVLKYYDNREILSQQELDGALYDDLLDYHKAISELPSEEYYDLIVAWDFHTYLLEPIQYSPIICLFAVPERGKSRTGKGMIYVAYRGIHVESLREAYIFRIAENFQATIFFDVMDIWNKALKKGSEDILLHRFEKSIKVPRVLFPEKGSFKDTVYYSIFGPTIIGTNVGTHKILETRAIQINMSDAGRRFENVVTPETGLPLKERLLAFRASHISNSLPDIHNPTAGRLGDILKPLNQIIRLVKPERDKAFLKLVHELKSDRLIENADSFEAQILSAVIGLKNQVKRGILTVKAVTEAFNDGKSERSQLTPHRIGRRLSAMGLKKVRGNDGASAIIWDDEKIERMRETYGLRKTSETSVMSEIPFLQSCDTDVSDDTDVYRNI